MESITSFKLDHTALCAPYVSKIETGCTTDGLQITKYHVALSEKHDDSLEFHLTIAGDKTIKEIQELIVNALDVTSADGARIVEEYKGKKI